MAFGKMGTRGGFGSLGLLGRAGVLWNPLNSIYTAAWWDAQFLPGLTFNSGNVASCTDRKSGVVVSQATGANQPGYSATARNGMPGFVFTGTQTLSGSSSSLPSGTNSNALFVAAYAPSSGSYSSPFAYGGGPGAMRGVQKSNSNTINITIYNTDFAGPSWSNSDIFVEGIFLSGTSFTGVADGVAFSGSLTTAYSTYALGTAKIGGLSNSFIGTVQQVVVCNAVPPTSVQQKYEGWESWYDGKAGSNLPSGHPYKYAPPYVGGP